MESVREISPTAERLARRQLVLARSAYVVARSACLTAASTWRRERTGRSLLAREDAMGAVLEARQWLASCRRYVAEIDDGTRRVTPFGGRLSPAAMARRSMTPERLQDIVSESMIVARADRSKPTT